MQPIKIKFCTLNGSHVQFMLQNFVEFFAWKKCWKNFSIHSGLFRCLCWRVFRCFLWTRLGWLCFVTCFSWTVCCTLIGHIANDRSFCGVEKWCIRACARFITVWVILTRFFVIQSTCLTSIFVEKKSSLIHCTCIDLKSFKFFELWIIIKKFYSNKTHSSKR